ncbi:cellulose biosynthesis protein BcsR [Pantoea sp.]|uniref:cellulose biosynthesis protein BcsR n=1 Tax=Pantoea sp. TaxID=69393 RepID=UPI00289E82AA|nr:cellulose biosynthesis protein BcsR [Pantoea sp.]
MKTENVFSPLASAGEQQDDISALGEAFSLTAFRYIDIAREERLAAIIARWPLLQELPRRQQENNG